MVNPPTQEIGYATEIGIDGTFWQTAEETPELRWPLSVRVFEQMRRQDAQITSVLRAVMLPVRRTKWRLDPADARPEVVEHIANDLGLPVKGGEEQVSRARRRRGRFSWEEHLQLALLSIQYGHMFFEQVYSLGDDGLYHLRKLGPRMPRTISDIKVARDGGLVAIEQYGFTVDTDLVSIPVDRLVAYVNEREGGDWVGNSLLRPAYKHWLIKDRLLRVQAQTIERNGMGVPVYEAGPNDDQAQMDRGAKIAQSYKAGSASGASTPNGAKLRLAGVEGNLPDANPAIRYHDEQIGRAVLAHFLNLGTQTGSWALGSTFADFFVLSLQTLGEQIADVANQHIVEDLVDANWGPEEPAPRLVFDEIGSRKDAVASALKLLVDAGILHTDRALEESVRQDYGLPAAEPESAESDPEQAPEQPETDPEPPNPPANSRIRVPRARIDPEGALTLW
ncbi:portal protein [Gordonia phage Ebert]|uniref:Portal protein n=1 Tax=Gordonia phage Ebert TaxID=2201426 RepID=A0A2Z4Q3J1_9CAUD|nr:portal protein [Gordonia phage Ebert]AZS12750.1 portal protein [Gordonia phage Sproutie]AZS12825.1 portal protein [Gordonia phage Savage]QGJ96627.1 portal protein [Gordonia phage Cynthia]QOC59127.1 portal protein [Gordonia phage GemG]QPL13569.1 portal protein [Gordonia phage Mocha12]QWT30272.1 portal protein [Gordonia phage TuertoX]UAJ15596.1 portal protein [Gordonia phage Gizermo]